MEANNIQQLASKDDLVNAMVEIKGELAKFKHELTMQIRNSIRWMFFFWITQVTATFAIFYFFLRK